MERTLKVGTPIHLHNVEGLSKPLIEDGSYEVEKILSHRTIDGQTEFLIKWKDYEETTWQTSEQVEGCSELLLEYYSQCNFQEE